MPFKNGKISIRGRLEEIMSSTDKIKELIEELEEKLRSYIPEVVKEKLPPITAETATPLAEELLEPPSLRGDLGCSEAILEILESPWGRTEPRTYPEIKQIMEQSAIYYSKGTITGRLTYLTKNGRIRRVKKGDLWGYILQ